MMDSEGTLWGEQRPGERAFQPAEETNLLIVHNGVPDWVRLPAQLGGQPVRVTGGERRPCPCGGTHQSLVLVWMSLLASAWQSVRSEGSCGSDAKKSEGVP